MDFVFIDVGQAEIFRQLGTPPPAFVQPFVEPPVTLLALACRGYIDGEEPSSCPKEPTSPTGGITGGHQSPDTAPPKEEGLEHTIDDNDLEGLLSCTTEQTAERERDAATEEAVNEINQLDQNIEHANFIVNLNGVPTPLNPVSGDENTVSTRGLIDQLISLGLNESHILVDIHSHPGTLNLVNSNAIAIDTFVNSFPSAGDYAAVESYVSTAVFFGANEAEWRESFAHVVIGRDDIAREFEEFTQPSNQDFPNNGIPERGTDERNTLEETLNDARNDAEGKCR